MNYKINWNDARRDYVSDPTMTYQEIADKYGVSLKAVKKNGARDGWSNERDKISLRAADKVVERASDKLAEVNDRHTNTYKNMQALGLAQLNIALAEVRRFQEDAKLSGGHLSINKEGMIGQQRLKFLYDALKVAMDGERITLGLPITVSVTKNEVSGKDGDALFEQVDMDELSDTITRAVKALGQRDAESNSAKDSSPS